MAEKCRVKTQKKPHRIAGEFVIDDNQVSEDIKNSYYQKVYGLCRGFYSIEKLIVEMKQRGTIDDLINFSDPLVTQCKVCRFVIKTQSPQPDIFAVANLYSEFFPVNVLEKFANDFLAIIQELYPGEKFKPEIHGGIPADLEVLFKRFSAE